MGGAEGRHGLDEYPGGFLRRQQRSSGQAHQTAGGEGQGLHHQVLDGLEEFGDSAHQLPLLIIAEPVHLVPRLDLHVGAQLVDLFPAPLEAGHHHRLYPLVLKGREPAAGQQLGQVLHRQVDAQVGLVGAVLFHGLQVGDAYKWYF